MAATAGQSQGAARLDLDHERRISYWQTLLRLLEYARPYRGQIALALAAMLAYSGTMMALPWTIKRAIDGQVMSEDGSFAGLAAAVGLFCLVALLRFAMGVVHSRLLVRFGESPDPRHPHPALRAHPGPVDVLLRPQPDGQGHVAGPERRDGVEPGTVRRPRVRAGRPA